MRWVGTGRLDAALHGAFHTDEPIFGLNCLPEKLEATLFEHSAGCDSPFGRVVARTIFTLESASGEVGQRRCGFGGSTRETDDRARCRRRSRLIPSSSGGPLNPALPTSWPLSRRMTRNPSTQGSGSVEARRRANRTGADSFCGSASSYIGARSAARSSSSWRRSFECHFTAVSSGKGA